MVILPQFNNPQAMAEGYYKYAAEIYKFNVPPFPRIVPPQTVFKLGVEDPKLKKIIPVDYLILFPKNPEPVLNYAADTKWMAPIDLPCWVAFKAISLLPSPINTPYGPMVIEARDILLKELKISQSEHCQEHVLKVLPIFPDDAILAFQTISGLSMPNIFLRIKD